MKIIAHLTFRPDTDLAAFLRLRAEEAAKVWSFYKLGILRDAELRADLKGAVLTFEAASTEDVRPHVESLPAVQAGLFAYELIPVGPFLSYETLFREG